METTRGVRERWLVLATIMLGGCAGNGSGLDQSGRPVSDPGGNGGALVAEFASIQSHIFTPICTVCHAGGSAPQGLRLDSVNSYSLLVGVSSNEEGSILRVKPGDPNNSYLIRKLEGHASVGARMPFGGPYLEQATIDVIRQWIAGGALRGSLARDSALAVTSVSPMNEDIQPDSRARLIVGFSEEIDQSRLDRGSVRVEALDQVTGAAVNEISVSLSVPAGNPRALIVMTTSPLLAGRYRVTAPIPPDTGLSGISGSRLGSTGVTPVPVVLAEFDMALLP